MGKRKVNVRQHPRRTKKGGRTTVSQHQRRLKTPTSSFYLVRAPVIDKIVKFPFEKQIASYKSAAMLKSPLMEVPELLNQTEIDIIKQDHEFVIEALRVIDLNRQGLRDATAIHMRALKKLETFKEGRLSMRRRQAHKTALDNLRKVEKALNNLEQELKVSL